MIGYLTLFLGLLISLLLVLIILKKESFTGIVAYTLSLFFVLVIITGHLFHFFGINLSLNNFLFAFIFYLSAVILTFNKSILKIPLKDLKEKNPVLNVVSDLVIFFAIFFLFLLPSIPALLPVSINVDSASHFLMIDRIYSQESFFTGTRATFPSGVPIQPESTPFFDLYPFGFHLNIAIISKFININPIYFVFPFVALISALSIIVTRQIILDYIPLKSNYQYFLSVLTIPLIFSSGYIFDSITYGFWGMGFAIFLIIIFMAFLFEYLNSRSYYSLFLLILVQISIVFSYPIFGLITFLGFPIVLILQNDIKSEWKNITLFLVFSGLLVSEYFFKLATSIGLKLPEGGITIPSFFSISPFLIIISIIGLVLYNKSFIKEQKIPSSFLVILVSILTLTGLMKILLNQGSFYFIYKFFYFTPYLLGIISVITLDKMLTPRILEKKSKKKGVQFKKNSGYLLLICLTLVILLNVFPMVEKYSETRAAVTPQQYALANWTKNNVHEKFVDIVAENPQIFWYYVLSGHPPKTPMPRWPCSDFLSYTAWQNGVRPGDILVVYNTPYVPDEWKPNYPGSKVNLSKFNVLYLEKSNYVLEYTGR
jgi:hypothetical protein